MFFGGAQNKIDRLGLQGIWNELENVLTGFEVRLNDHDNRDVGTVLRKLLDNRFRSLGSWNENQGEGVDWTRCHKVNGARVCVGVEIQFSVSAQSDLLLVDLQYLYDEIIAGRIDVGVIVVPSTKLAQFLADDVATYRDAVRDIQRANASHYPLAALAFEHDRAGPVLRKGGGLLRGVRSRHPRMVRKRTKAAS
jgi:hypothetical protein